MIVLKRLNRDHMLQCLKPIANMCREKEMYRHKQFSHSQMLCRGPGNTDEAAERSILFMCSESGDGVLMIFAGICLNFTHRDHCGNGI